MLRLSSLFQFKHGDHICVFYRDEDSLREVLIPYISDGLHKGEKCFCAQKPHVCKQIIYDLRFLGVDVDRALASGALELHSENEVYLPRQHFEPEEMTDMLVHAISDAQSKGFSGFRSAGELSWAVQGRSECDKVVAYEKMVSEKFPNQPATGLCQYNVNEFEPAVLESVMRVHSMHLAEHPPAGAHAGIYVRDGNYSFEFVADRLVIDPHHYYVVERDNPREIVGWGVADNFENARQKADRVITQANGRTNGALA